MYFKINLCVFAIIVFAEAELPVRLTIQPDEVLKSFKSIVSSDYIKILADDFATKAAEHFINEIKTKQINLERDYNARLRWQELLETNRNGEKQQKDSFGSIHEGGQEEWSKIHSKKSPDIGITRKPTELIQKTEKPPVLNEEQAMALLDDPSPDGDNLGDQLSDAEAEEATKAIPVIGVMKINGVYYRRLLGMI